MHKHPYPLLINEQIYHIGRGICEKYQSRDEKFPDPTRQGKLSFKTGIFRKYPSQYDISF